MNFLGWLGKYRNKRLVRSVANDASGDQLAFMSAIESQLTPLFAKHGFKTIVVDVRENASDFLWRNKDRYISISSSTHPTDHPYPFDMMLGVGRDCGAEATWNSLPLTMIARMKGVKEPNAALMFPFRESEKALAGTRRIVEECCLDFLKGNMDSFLQLRKQHNVGRKPFTIIFQDWHGNKSEVVDPKSEEIRKKFS